MQTTSIHFKAMPYICEEKRLVCALKLIFGSFEDIDELMMCWILDLDNIVVKSPEDLLTNHISLFMCILEVFFTF